MTMTVDRWPWSSSSWPRSSEFCQLKVVAICEISSIPFPTVDRRPAVRGSEIYNGLFVCRAASRVADLRATVVLNSDAYLLGGVRHLDESAQLVGGTVREARDRLHETISGRASS